jgi:ferredoxin
MLNALETACAERGMSNRLHIERFTAPVSGGDDDTALHEDDAEFEVVLERSATRRKVRADQSLLDAIRDVAPILSSCEEGYCGTCKVRVPAGVPDHRDTVLTEDERQENRTMMVCVSRSFSPELTLDI